MIWSQLFDVDYIDTEFIIKSNQLDDYYSMNKSIKDINSNKLKYLLIKIILKRSLFKLDLIRLNFIFIHKMRYH
jgi:hypothetical protein